MGLAGESLGLVPLLVPCYNLLASRAKGGKPLKTDKELAVKLAGDYIQAVYSRDGVKLPEPSDLKVLLKAFYDAVKSLPDE